MFVREMGISLIPAAWSRHRDVNPVPTRFNNYSTTAGWWKFELVDNSLCFPPTIGARLY